MAKRSGIAISLLFSAITCCGLVAAKEPSPLDLLVFDAVPLSIVISEGNADNKQPTYVATELATLPHEHAQSVKALMEQSLLSPNDSADLTHPADIAALETALKQQELKGNAYDNGLAEILVELGSAYESAGEFAKALTTFERANHIIRVNNGLQSLAQEPLLQRMIHNHMALGDFAATDADQEYLFYLRSKVYKRESLKLIPALQDLANWDLRASRGLLLQGLTGQDNSRVTFQVGDSNSEQYNFRFQHLQQAQLLYQRIIDILLTRGDKSDPRLAQTQQSLAITDFFMSRHMIARTLVSNTPFSNGPPILSLRDFHPSFSEGRTALERRIKYLAESAKTAPAELARARLDLVDWLIATNSYTDFKEVLLAAYSNYVDAGAKAADVDTLFSPQLPVAVPSFVIKPYTREAFGLGSNAALEYQGYVDIEYGINSNGEPTVPKILYQTPGTSPQIVEMLKQSIAGSQFRPPVVEGVVVPSSPVLRYYYAW